LLEEEKDLDEPWRALSRDPAAKRLPCLPCPPPQPEAPVPASPVQ